MTQKRAIDKLRAELERVQNEVAELRSQAAEQMAATHQDMLTLRSQLSAARAEAGTFKRKFEVCCLCVVEACTGVGRGGGGGGGGGGSLWCMEVRSAHRVGACSRFC